MAGETASFNTSVVAGSLTVVFTDTSSASTAVTWDTVPYDTTAYDVSGITSPTSWLWNFGDSQTSTLQNPSHTYATAGTYTVMLTASWGTTNVTSTPMQVTVSQASQQASFVYGTQNGSLGVSFADQSGPTTPTSWLWDFGDGQTSTLQHPNHRYDLSGTYTTVLTATWGTTSLTSAPAQFTLTAIRQSSFTYNTTNNSLVVAFTNTSGQDIPDSYLWNFGDGQTSTLRNPTHTYATSGTYSVVLTVFWGTTSEVSTPAQITVNSATVNPYQASFNTNTTPGSLIVTFTDTSSSTPISGWDSAPYDTVAYDVSTITPPTTWLWNFGDGQTSILQNPTHTYANSGTYSVVLTAAWGTNSAISDPVQVTVTQAVESQHTSFTVNKIVGNYPLTVMFTDTSGPIVPDSWLWDFGDGQTSTLQNPSHTYNLDGIYNVILTTMVGNTSYTGVPVTITATNPLVPVDLPSMFTGEKVKVQGGHVLYSNANPALPLDFYVKGRINVSEVVQIGTTTIEDSIITTPNGTTNNSSNLEITTGAYGKVNIHQHPTGGALTLNNVQWPSGVIQPVPGMFMGVSDVNTLEYYPFILGSTNNNTMTNDELSLLYPNAVVGQSVLGPNVIYACISQGLWRTLGSSAPTPQPTPTQPETLVVQLSGNSGGMLDGNAQRNWTGHNVLITSVDAHWDSTTSAIVIDTPGIYRVTVKGLINASVGIWSDTTVAYGTIINEALDVPNTSQYFRPSMSIDIVPGDSTLSNPPIWTDTFTIGSATTEFQIGMYGYSQTSEVPVDFTATVSVTRIFGTENTPG